MLLVEMMNLSRRVLVDIVWSFGHVGNQMKEEWEMLNSD